jgi:hypothetical protein
VSGSVIGSCLASMRVTKPAARHLDGSGDFAAVQELLEEGESSITRLHSYLSLALSALSVSRFPGAPCT